MPIPVTKPFMPPLEEYQALLEGIWEREWLTNHGPLVTELESALRSHLGVQNLVYVTNGTIAIQIALKALGISGEIITTPFSYVATVSSAMWEGLQPVMADIDPASLNLDPSLIEAAITDRTTAILATHVFGNPCDVIAIQEIADRHKLKVIYDAAHAFGTRYAGQSVYAYGDAATASFHATKLFHTVEGGAIFTRSEQDLLAVSRMRNFGHVTPTSFDRIGINGKNSEFHAAFGLVNLRYIAAIHERRKAISERYDRALGNSVGRPTLLPGCEYNFAYYPVLVDNEATLLKLVSALEARDVIPRRYFYPSLSELPYLTHRRQTPVSSDIARRILCLPLYHTLSEGDQDLVCSVVLDVVGR
jgi:dTDP-4-amino-4,6-dideoxygalactose transaminase